MHRGAVDPSPGEVKSAAEQHLQRADFKKEQASQEVRRLADWVVDSADNHHMSFVIVDKIDAKVFVFDAGGRLRGAAPALLGLSLGDDSVPGIGDRRLSTMHAEERITPAGRFVAALGHNSEGKGILWVDYEDSISLHPVIKGKPEEHRAQRLESPTVQDNRITYGCINVPLKFYNTVVNPSFTGRNGIVYVMPETRKAREVFGSYDVDERARPPVARSDD